MPSLKESGAYNHAIMRERSEGNLPTYRHPPTHRGRFFAEFTMSGANGLGMVGESRVCFITATFIQIWY